MFSSREFLPPRLDGPFASIPGMPAIQTPQLPPPWFSKDFKFTGYQPIDNPFENHKPQGIEQPQIPSPGPAGRFQEHQYANNPHGVLTEHNSSWSRQSEKSGYIKPRVAMNEFPRQSDSPVSNISNVGGEYSRTIADLTTALTQAMSERSQLIAENASLKDKVSVYEERLNQVDGKFQAMMNRISALESQNSKATESVKSANRLSESSPKSPHSVRSVPSGARPRSVSATSRSSRLTIARPEPPARSVSVERERRTPASQAVKSVALASRNKISQVARRSVSPARISSTDPTGQVQNRVTSPIIRYEAHIFLNDRIVAKAQISPSLSQDGPFLYVIQSELKPAMTFFPEDGQPPSSPFKGISISVVGTNTRLKKTSTIFKSHSSHVISPPVNDSDKYFSHSCWLSGPEASVVGGVRIFYRSEAGGICLYAMSLKYWFPETSGTAAPNFTKDHWRELLKLLGLL